MTSRRRAKALNTKGHRGWLIESVRTHLLPALVEYGFEVSPPAHSGPVDRESVLSFPDWGRLIRGRESGVDLIEIQLAPRRRAAFRINAGVAPKEGIDTPTGHWSGQDVLVHWLYDYFEMYSLPRWRIWFSVRNPLYRSRTPSDYDQLIIRVTRLIPEVESALREGRLGPHMRRVVIRRGSADRSGPPS
jgi:hypothetical protein